MSSKCPLCVQFAALTLKQRNEFSEVTVTGDDLFADLVAVEQTAAGPVRRRIRVRTSSSGRGHGSWTLHRDWHKVSNFNASTPGAMPYGEPAWMIVMRDHDASGSPQTTVTYGLLSQAEVREGKKHHRLAIAADKDGMVPADQRQWTVTFQKGCALCPIITGAAARGSYREGRSPRQPDSKLSASSRGSRHVENTAGPRTGQGLAELTPETLQTLSFVYEGEWALAGDGIQFKVPQKYENQRHGVYAFAVSGRVTYVGVSLRGVSERLPHYMRPSAPQNGKMRTSQRVNELLTEALKAGQSVGVWIWSPSDQKVEFQGHKIHLGYSMEQYLIENYKPTWNKRGKGKM